MITYPLTVVPATLEARGRVRHYTLTLNKNQLEDLAFVDSGSGVIARCAEDHVGFRLFHAQKTDKAFRPMPYGTEAYYAYIGDMRIRTVADMVKLLRRHSPMPIEIDSVVPGDRRPINLGYVHFKTVFGSYRRNT